MSIAKALLELTPGAKWVIRDDVIDWMDTEQTQPTQEEIVQKIAELEYREEVEEYRRVRELAYPSSGEQFDKIFHDGVDAWKADIQAIKDAHPKAVIDADELASRQAQALFDYQLKEYTKAQERLAQYQVALGRDEITEEFVIGQEWNEETEQFDNITETRVVSPAIEPVEPTVTVMLSNDMDAVSETIENPLITKDNEERAEAQAIIDATPQEVIDAYSTL